MTSKNKLNITSYICPMTFVKTRIALDQLPAGATLEVHLKGKEPLVNIRRNVQELGYKITNEISLENNETIVVIYKSQ
ncbi:sulfurtransferase TusA family protein [Entomobacter blattae]|uniref:Sulfurtransferase TusA n=1 Tax=Entomobacter blattae TaxID=2762277 RepID=A0A7H1NP04_9PROT|nr:sulfurtransferase TusA family protein [Entomobacter blattae]QNT77514.1 Sulfurtransferase TusA [Entomobacter blattae]